MEETGLGEANASTHLRSFPAAHLVQRRKDGVHLYYALADSSVFEPCDLACGRLQDATRRWRPLTAGPNGER
jgi:DNA-binding transcriptional ArsR family regulator